MKKQRIKELEDAINNCIEIWSCCIEDLEIEIYDYKEKKWDTSYYHGLKLGYELAIKNLKNHTKF